MRVQLTAKKAPRACKIRRGRVRFQGTLALPQVQGRHDDETVEGFNETLQGYDNPPNSENRWHENVGSDSAEKEIGWELGEDIWPTLW